MANALPACRFRWGISNPFVPLRRLETKLYHASPHARLWEVTLQPVSRTLKQWHFKFFLKYVQCAESDIVFIADRVRVDISQGGRNMDTKDKPRYVFHPGNQHTYQFDISLTSPTFLELYKLDIEIWIDFQDEHTELRPGEELHSTAADFADLSLCMTRLFEEPIFSDVRLESTSRVFPVHFCVLVARWKGFLDENNLIVPPDEALETNISDSLLRRILLYMYSGVHYEITFLYPNLALITELFQVVDRYNIYHLYKVFVANDSEQRRLTVRNITSLARSFPLDGNIGPQVNAPSHVWPVGRSGPRKLIFRIQFFMVGDTPRFSYSLGMVTGPRCYALVTLQFVQQVVLPGNSEPRRNFWTVHQRDYRIEPGGLALSGDCPFEGRPLPLENIGRGRRRVGRGELSYSIRCVLHASDGTESVVVKTLGTSVWQSKREVSDALSNHLYLLRRDPTHADLCVFCPGTDPHFLHKAILAARVPRWREVVVVNGGDPQETADTEVSCFAFDYILDYMYTGKTSTIPTALFDEIEQFAVTGGFFRLQNNIIKLRRDNIL